MQALHMSQYLINMALKVSDASQLILKTPIRYGLEQERTIIKEALDMVMEFT